MSAVEAIPPDHCDICGFDGADAQTEVGVRYHAKCLTCEKCGSDFIIWQRKGEKRKLRCMECFHYWETVPFRRRLQVL